MKKLATVFVVLMPMVCLAQKSELTVAPGAATNGTLSTFKDVIAWNESQEMVGSGVVKGKLDPGLNAFAALNNDVHMADSFFNEPLRTLRDDEVVCATMWFGRAWACKATNPKQAIATVVTQPMSAVYRHWIEQIATDFIEFKRLGASSKKGVEFIKGLEQEYQDDHDSVWFKLKTNYCDERPLATYLDIDGQPKSCKTLARP